ncbi:hypothetical protein [Nocardia sp. NPDC058497]|uniref:hypothetical protein n=1 Tax=Nocardia sp. NPDC058497 TaxID=3346529 RepID=UPI003647DE2C
MTPGLTAFFRYSLNIEFAYATRWDLRAIVNTEPDAEEIRTELAAIIKNRTMTVVDYDDITGGIEFPDEDSLYEYLTSMYAHLYEDAEPQPIPPV